MISATDFLKETGYVLDAPAQGPTDLRSILIATVLACVPAKTLHDYLHKRGRDTPTRTLVNWIKGTRDWLGLPKINRGKAGAKYRDALAQWHLANGYPTTEELDAGWLPVHRRSGSAPTAPILKPEKTQSPVNAPVIAAAPVVKKTGHPAPAPVPAKKKSTATHKNPGAPAGSTVSVDLEKLAPLVDFANAPETGPLPDDNLDQNKYSALIGPIFENRREFLRNSNEQQGPAEGQNAVRRSNLFLALVKEIPWGDPDFHATRYADLTMILRVDAANISKARWINETHNARRNLAEHQSAASS